MRTRDLLLLIVVFTATTLYAQTEELTKNAFLTHAAFYSYPNESSALKDIRETNPKFIELTDLCYTTLKDRGEFSLHLINEDVDSRKWDNISHANSVKTSPDDKVIVFRGSINLKKYASFREVFLCVGAAGSSSRIYINGKEVGGSSDSKATIEYDITNYLEEELNNLAIVCFDDGSPIELKGAIGIASTIDIYTKSKVHILDVKYTTTISENSTLALLESQAILKSHLLNKRPFRLEYKLFSQEGELLNRSFVDSDIEMKTTQAFPFLSTLKDPKIWSPSSPYLYTILYSIYQDGRVTEVVRQDVGIRDYATKIDSVVAVSLTPNLSYSASEAAAEANMIRSIGVNTIISNTPMNDTYLTACDRAGLYVVDMINIDNIGSGSSLLVGGSLANNPMWLQNHLERTERQIVTNGAHTSVIGWQLTSGGANGYNIYEAYLHAKKLEKHRPIINRVANGEWNSDAFVTLEKGVVGAWESGDMLTAKGELSEKSYKMMEAQSSVYVRPINASMGVFKIINNTSDSLTIGDLTYKVSVNDIALKEGVIIEEVVEPNSFIEHTIEKYNEIPLAMQLKNAQQLRFGKKYLIEIFSRGTKVYHVVIK